MNNQFFDLDNESGSIHVIDGYVFDRFELEQDFMSGFNVRYNNIIVPFENIGPKPVLEELKEMPIGNGQE